MQDLIAKFRALPMKARALLVVLSAFASLTIGDYALRTRPAALNAGRPVVIQQQGNTPAPGKIGATGDNPQNVTITGAGMNLQGLKLLSLADGTASSDGAAFHQIADAINASTYDGSVTVVAAANIASLSGLANTVDGVAISSAVMRVCSFVQSTGTQDGCYQAASGAWTRLPQMASGSDAEGSVVFAELGTANQGVWAVHASGAQIVGTNDLTAAKIASNSGGGGSFPPGGDLAMGNFGFTGARDAVATGEFATINQIATHRARVVTTAALPAYTYANGSSGVGATITLNSNVAIPTIDGATMSLNDIVLVTTGAALSDNGLYKITQLGNGSSTPGILTRSDRADTASKLGGLQIEILDGNSSKTGAPVYILVTPASSITVGTTGLVFLRASTGGSPRLAYQWSSDFDSGLAAVANGVAINNSPFTAAVSGTGATFTFNNTGAGNTDTEIGIATLTSGTSASAVSAAGNFGGSFNWGTNAAIWIATKARVQTALSNGTNTFDCHLGTVAAGFAAGVWWSCDSNADTHWRLIVKSAGTTTQVGTSTIVVNQWDTLLTWKDAGSNQIHWAVSGVQQPDPATTNTPTATPTAPYLSADRSAGTGGVIQVDYTAGAYYLPAGRGI